MLESLFFGFSFSSAHLAVQCAHVNYFFAFLESISINSWLHILFVSSLFSFQGTHCVGAISRRLYNLVLRCVSLPFAVLIEVSLTLRGGYFAPTVRCRTFVR